MKNSIYIFSFITFFFFFNSSLIFSQTIDNGEFMFVNKSSSQIFVKIYPNGAIFNGNNEYNLFAYHPISEQEEHRYIYPKGPNPLILDPYNTGSYFKRANFDRDQFNDNCNFSLGFGKYRIDIDDNNHPTFSFDIDFSDADFCGVNPDYYRRIKINYNSYNDITYNFIANDGITDFNPITITQENNTINVWKLNGTPHQGWFTQNKGDFTEASDVSEFLTWPLIATGNYQALGHLNPEQYNLSLKISNHDITLEIIDEEKPVKFNNCKLTINDGYNFTIYSGQNSVPRLQIIGENAEFISKNGSAVIASQNFMLSIMNNAIIQSNGTIFCSDADILWFGIYLLHPGSSYFDNCIFINSYYPILSINNSNYLKITNNTIIFPNFALSTGFLIGNSPDVLFQKNKLYMPTKIEYSTCGITIFKEASSEEENNIFSGYFINILENEFYDGDTQILINGSGENDIPVYINKNTFTNGLINMALLQSTGTISYNVINSNNSDNCNILLQYSNSNFLHNVINGDKNNFILQDKSYPNFSPDIASDEEVLLIAGINNFKSNTLYNIYLNGPYEAYFYTNFGGNSFDIENPLTLHLKAVVLNTTDLDYYSIGNCWYLYGNSTSPLKNLVNVNSADMNIITGPPPSACNIWDYQITDRIIKDRGHGIFDTILITQASNFSPQTADVKLFGTGVKNEELKNYSSSILSFKNLINSYSNSKYFENSIIYLYECYVLSDTNHNQGWRNIIFGDLKNYLENKIQQYENNDEFISVAFDYLLKCKTKIKNYQPAMDGYEFIAENSPSATERLMASINYIDVEGLLLGGSGGNRDDVELGNSKELNPEQTGKPIKDILLASYKNTKKSNEKKEKSELENSNDAVKTKSELNKKHSFEKKLENRAIENISISSGLTKKERRERIQKDLMLLTKRSETSEKIVKKNNIEPLKYELSQNYPNPFNPITNIKYQIQKTGLVTLRIYDITGREIKTLVNEIKNPGSYIVTFNGSEFASGVYFYRIQAGDFVQVKKTVLIK